MRKFKITEKGVNFLLIFILGFLVGVALKSEAQKRVTLGFNDYLVSRYKSNVNLLAPSQPPIQPQAENENAEQQNSGPVEGNNNQQ